MVKNLKKLIRKCPFLLLLVSTGILFSLIGLCGKKNVYAGQEYDPLKEPASAIMFRALKEDIYPWQIFDREYALVMASGNENAGAGEITSGANEEDIKSTDLDSSEEQNSDNVENADDRLNGNDEGEDAEDSGNPSENNGGEIEVDENQDDQGIDSDNSGKEDDSEAEEKEETGDATQPSDDAEKVSDGNSQKEGISEAGKSLPKERIKPLRESTREEYLNHISADIYGDAGVKRAAEYEFSEVDESYFDDALFIGDSRIVGLKNYTDLSEHADFYCETSLTIQKILKENYPGLGTIEEALANKDYGKIYIMSGINELGVGTTENFLDDYTEVIDFLHEREPEAKIFIQGIMRVTGKKHSKDAIFNNNNINARNNAIATLADNEQIFYIDVNEVVCDEEGNLNTEYTYDQLHLLGVYNDLWKQFLLAHGVT